VQIFSTALLAQRNKGGQKRLKNNYLPLGLYWGRGQPGRGLSRKTWRGAPGAIFPK